MLFICPLLRLLCYVWRPENVCLQYELLPCHMEGLVLGALIAIRLRRGPWEINKWFLTLFTATLLVAACVGSITSKPTISDWAWTSPFNRLIGYSISSWGCAGMILWMVVFRGAMCTSWARVGVLQYLGKISYGIYLLHPVVLRLMLGAEDKGIHFRADGLPRFVVLVASTILAASLSWYFFEKPILGLKDKWAPSTERRPPRAVAETATGEFTAQTAGS
jgi:peptidoglycan/LPS O-acetylase OafA/YrhL